MNPDLEVVQIRRGESFKAWAHGYPFHTVRWHFHPEYELHHVVATTGPLFRRRLHRRVRAGQPGADRPQPAAQLGQRHAAGTCVPLRGRIVQFTEEFIADATKALPELAACAGILELSRRGALFSARDRRACRPHAGGTRAGAGRAPDRAVHGDARHAEPRRGRPDADQRELSARSFRLHVGRHQQGAGLYQRAT